MTFANAIRYFLNSLQAISNFEKDERELLTQLTNTDFNHTYSEVKFCTEELWESSDVENVKEIIEEE